VKPLASLYVLLLCESITHLFGHILELRQNALVKLLGIGIFALFHEFTTHISNSFKIESDALEGVWVSADGVTTDLTDLEADVDVVADGVLLFLGLVEEVSAAVVGALMVKPGEPYPGYFTPLHRTHHNLVVLMIAWILHLKLLVDLTSLLEIYELSVVVASLMFVVDIIRILNDSPSTLLHHKLEYAARFGLGEILVANGRQCRVLVHNEDLHCLSEFFEVVELIWRPPLLRRDKVVPLTLLPLLLFLCGVCLFTFLFSSAILAPLRNRCWHIFRLHFLLSLL
jgi:hypothetical protein